MSRLSHWTFLWQGEVISMKRLLKAELHKAFRNWYFLGSIFLGTVFVALSAYQQISEFYSDLGFMYLVKQIREMGYTKYPLAPMSILYNSWIGGETSSVGVTLFFTLLPLLAVLPYGRSFSQERQCGYLKVIIPRCGRTKYFSAKFIAVFLSGGTAVVIPQVLSLMINSLVFPAVKPSVLYDQYFGFSHESMMAALAHTHPMIYTIIYLCIDFVFSGLYACLSISASFFFRQRLAPLVVPFLILTGADMLQTLLLYISYIEISPLLLMHAIPIANFTKAIVLLGWFLIWNVMTILVLFQKGKRYEIL